jgi:drug/metabolite transporter (DMT)-like permease
LRVSWPPVTFVLLWSTGFIVARYATDDAGPLTFLTIRLALSSLILVVVAAVMSAPAIDRGQVVWAGIVGVGLHAVYLGGVFVAIGWGLPSGVSALIGGLHPVVTTIAARFALDERLRPMQWVGVGLGFAGVVAVVVDRLSAGVSGITAGALAAMVISVAGISSGTVVQRARGTTMPLLRGTAVQYAVSAAVLLPAALVWERFDAQFTWRFVLSLAWAVLVLSLAAVLLMLWLLQRQAAASVSSLFFLTPALSTLEAAILFGERLGPLALVGLAAALTGVALTTRSG